MEYPTLMLIAIGKTGDVQIVSEPRKIITLASSIAEAGLPEVIVMLSEETRSRFRICRIPLIFF